MALLYAGVFPPILFQLAEIIQATKVIPILKQTL